MVDDISRLCLFLDEAADASLLPPASTAEGADLRFRPLLISFWLLRLRPAIPPAPRELYAGADDEARGG